MKTTNLYWKSRIHCLQPITLYPSSSVCSSQGCSQGQVAIMMAARNYYFKTICIVLEQKLRDLLSFYLKPFKQPGHSNATFTRIRISLKPHNFLHEAAFSPQTLTETASFWSRSSAWFKTPSTRIWLNRYAVLETSKFVWTGPNLSLTAVTLYLRLPRLLTSAFWVRK